MDGGPRRRLRVHAAGRLFLIEVLIAIAASTLAASLLSVTSGCILSRFGFRVLFVAAIGVLLAVVGDLPKFGIGGYPASDALLLAARDVVSWALAGLVIASVMRLPGGALPEARTAAPG